MSVVVEIENPITEKIKDITGETSDHEAIKVALERFVRDYEVKPKNNGSSDEISHDLPDEYWDGLFSKPMLPNNAGSQAVIDERNEARY